MFYRLQYSSQKQVETGTVSLEFLEKSWDLLLTPFFSLKCALSLLNVEPHAYFEAVRPLQYPNHVGKGETDTSVSRFLTSIVDNQSKKQ